MGFALVQRRSEIGAVPAQPKRSAGKLQPRAPLPRWTDLPLLQPRLQIGAPNDRFEQEADSIADLIVGMPAPNAHSIGSDVTASSKPAPSVVQRQCAACSEGAQVVQLELVFGSKLRTANALL
jgi:hypothetical protein